jgi:hypothetical protein
MHNLHFILIRANDASGAVSNVEDLIDDWGTENNWRCVGGIASEDGSDDVENHNGGAWDLSFLIEEGGCSKDGTYFDRAVTYLHTQINDPVTLTCSPHSTYPDLRSACSGLGDALAHFDPEHDEYFNLWAIGGNVTHLSMLLKSCSAVQRSEDIPEHYSWQFDEFGLTDLTGESEGARRYIILLDTHC